MKKIILLGFLVVSLVSWSGCDHSTNSISVGNGIGTWSLEDYVNSISSSQSCGKTWGDRESVNLYFSNYLLQTIPAAQRVDIYNEFLDGSVNLDLISSILYNNGVNSQFTDFNLVVYLEKPFFSLVTGTSIERTINFRLYHAGNVTMLEEDLCSGKTYSIFDLVSFPSNNANPLITFGNSTPFDQNGNVVLSQTANDDESVTYTANYFGYPIKRVWDMSIYEMGAIAYSIIPDPLTIQSNNIDVETMVTFTTGTGYSYESELSQSVFMSGSDYIFSPALAGDGIETIKVRSVHYGCRGTWVDTVINIQPIVAILSPPTINLDNTFGVGETGINAKYALPATVTGSFPNTQQWPAQTGNHGKFHFGCSNSTYTFYINSPVSGLQYEWYTLHNGIIDTLGTGTSKAIVFNSNYNENISQSQSLNPFPIVNNDMPFYLQGNNGMSVFGGDIVTILFRSKNVLGDVSSFRKAYIGIVNKPEFNLNNQICYDEDSLQLYAVSNVGAYTDSLLVTDIRTTRWNTDIDNFWELYGDTIPFALTNNLKYNLVSAQMIDSTKMYVWNGSQYIVSVEPQADIVCYSAIEDVPLIIKPHPNITLSDSGYVNIGTPVLSFVTGQYFIPSSDSIIWSWSDDNNNFYGDSSWHYLNDFGPVNISVEVIDQYGCSSTVSINNSLFVPGNLGFEEVLIDNIIYPNPCTNFVNIESWMNDQVSVYSINGLLIENFTVKESIKETNGWGNQVFLINTTQGKYVKLIINN